jgi:hypothetical protein
MDNSSIVVDERLWEAYRNTIYAVPELGLEIEISVPNAPLQNYLSANGFTRWAFITAWNPRSVLLTEAQNAARNQQMERWLMDKKYLYFDGYGQGKTSDWPPENSFFVLGINRETAIQLGRDFGQLAIVVGERDTVAELQSLV